MGFDDSFPRSMPSVDDVVEFWRENGAREWTHAETIGWGEPFCFGCGWLAPVREGLSSSWRESTSWLDRAHLQDHCVAGDDSPANLVMLCHLCHVDMPEFDDRDTALQWVKDVASCSWMWQLFTDIVVNENRSAWPRSSRTKLLRLRNTYLEGMAKIREEGST